MIGMSRGEIRTVGLEGAATIYEVAKLREAFGEALAESAGLRVELDDSTKWDLAGLQLLVSCERAARDEGRAFTLAKVPRACVEVAERAGLSEWLESVTATD